MCCPIPQQNRQRRRQLLRLVAFVQRQFERPHLTVVDQLARRLSGHVVQVHGRIALAVKRRARIGFAR